MVVALQEAILGDFFCFVGGCISLNDIDGHIRLW
ncbi:hypothetical protein Patl1_02444 [Pistacia atlantica]|uniref:Uncharacterized protein n=1 Tax=Pistacia atlantica TaxID=434234 RepID=A0ACC1C7M4_9ROSI|nr:hypothetical protein Patl1_02444 [Pistacia atlantica]